MDYSHRHPASVNPTPLLAGSYLNSIQRDALVQQISRDNGVYPIDIVCD